MNSVTAGSSTLLRLYAADPTPRSAVCLNQDGSLEASDVAMSSLDFSVSSSPVASGVARGERVAFSAATSESGRLPPEDLGRCCHDSVPVRANGVGDSLLAIVLGSRGAWGLDDDDDGVGVACLSLLEGVVTTGFSGLIERARSGVTRFKSAYCVDGKTEDPPALRAALSSLPLAMSCSSWANRAASSRSRCSPNSRIFLMKSAGEMSSCSFGSEVEDMASAQVKMVAAGTIQETICGFGTGLGPLSVGLVVGLLDGLESRHAWLMRAQGQRAGLGGNTALISALISIRKCD